jgi:hypothetical protein
MEGASGAAGTRRMEETKERGDGGGQVPQLATSSTTWLDCTKGPSACLWRACKCAFLMGPNHEHMSTRGTSVNNVLVLCPSAPRLPLKRGSFPAEPHMASGQRQRVKKKCRTGSTAETEQRRYSPSVRQLCFGCSVAPSVCSVTPSPSLLAPFPSLTRIHHPAVMLFSCPSHCVGPCAQVRALPNGRGGFSSWQAAVPRGMALVASMGFGPPEPPHAASTTSSPFAELIAETSAS